VPDYALPAAQYPHGGAYRATPVKHVQTIMDEMQAAGLSWRIYSGQGGSPTLHTGNQSGYGWAICPTFADCLYTSEAQNFLDVANFASDVQVRGLPKLTIITPPQAASEHNGDSMAAGDNWLGQIMAAVQSTPQWNTTAVFVTWDDCGCFYDHVPPPADLGIRVPMLIISPYARPGYTDHNNAQFASVLAYVEHTFGLAPLATADSTAYDFSGAFNYSQTPLLAPVKAVVTPISSAEKAYLAAHPDAPDDPT